MWYETLLVAPHVSVAHDLIYTLSNYMRHEGAKRSECAHAVHYTSWPKGVVQKK